MTIEVIEPHGLCAGVDAAIAKAMAERNVYCLHELIHNERVVDQLKARGYRFVESVEEVPEGATVVFSAHGVAPSIRRAAQARHLRIVDTTCAFVSRVHRAARQFSERGLPVVVIGDARHVEVRGIVGECNRVCVWQRGEPLDFAAGTRLGVVSQTTMNAEEVSRAVDELKVRYEVETMAEVCQATRERQAAVRHFCCGRETSVLVVGSATSSNSRRLAEVAREAGARAFQAATVAEVDELLPELSRASLLGLTSGASTPESLFDEVLDFLRVRLTTKRNIP